MKNMLSSKKLEQTQPQNVLTMCQFERKSMEMKIIFALMIKESKESKEQDKEHLVLCIISLMISLTCGLFA